MEQKQKPGAERTIVVDPRGQEIMLALIEGGTVCEAAHLPAEVSPRIGDIYLGRVQQVLPGIGASFVDVGLDRNAFLPMRPDEPPLLPGQQVLVQVLKQPGGDKGVHVSRAVTLVGRLLTLSPTGGKLGVSAKITDAAERGRLRRIAGEICPADSGMVLRSAAEGQQEAALRAECETLRARWDRLRREAEHQPAPKLLLASPHPVERFVRDLLGQAPTRIVTGDAVWRDHLAAALKEWGPQPMPTLEQYGGETPLGALYPVQIALEHARQRRVWLPGGGYLIFDVCEAMTVIDVNIGKQAGGLSLEETALDVNLQAAREIAVQLRLRDIGGIVVIDTIDLRQEANRAELLETFGRAFAQDRGKPRIAGGISALGLVQLTRKRLYALPMERRGAGRPRAEGEAER